MSEVRLIDANALERTAIPCEIHNGALTDLCVPLYQIRHAPTVQNAWVMTADGWTAGYGCDIYLIGVFSSEKAAMEYQKSLIAEFGGKENIPYDIRLTKILIDFPEKMECYKGYSYDFWANYYFLGGHVE